MFYCSRNMFIFDIHRMTLELNCNSIWIAFHVVAWSSLLFRFREITNYFSFPIYWRKFPELNQVITNLICCIFGSFAEWRPQKQTKSRNQKSFKVHVHMYVWMGGLAGKHSGSVKMNGNWLKNDNRNATMTAKTMPFKLGHPKIVHDNCSLLGPWTL